MKVSLEEAKKLLEVWEKVSNSNRQLERNVEERLLVEKRLSLFQESLAKEHKIPIDEVMRLPFQTELGPESRARFLLLQSAMISLDKHDVDRVPVLSMAGLFARQGL